jgi:hypothetical protein
MCMHRPQIVTRKAAVCSLSSRGTVLVRWAGRVARVKSAINSCVASKISAYSTQICSFFSFFFLYEFLHSRIRM